MQKSRQNGWCKLGDKNTQFFHLVTGMRSSQNNIIKICHDGVTCNNRTDVNATVVSYFSDLFNKAEWDRARMGPEGLKTLSSLQIRELQQDITMDGVRQAVRDCDGSKAPRSDGFTFTFYKKALLLAGEDIFDMVTEFFKNEKLPNGINTTNAKLVPNKFSDYRSLSLVRGLYKIVRIDSKSITTNNVFMNNV